MTPFDVVESASFPIATLAQQVELYTLLHSGLYFSQE